MKALERMTGKQLTDAIGKSEVVTFRVSPAVKRDMKAAAAALGLTMTEYLCSLHSIAVKKLK
jgi:antitoxin component of RelBE/YafQ-DinJ toxin-antitoxin module